LATKSPEKVPSYVPPMFSATRPARGDAARIRNSPARTSARDRDASQLPLTTHLLSSARSGYEAIAVAVQRVRERRHSS
jgi:hypothetical protein